MPSINPQTSNDGVKFVEFVLPNSSSNSAAEFSNPYYLHHRDSPGTLLVSQPLVGRNYHTWKRSMVMALSTKNKLDFIDAFFGKTYC
jgi:predicted YcjX-like family ATPase